MEPLRVNWDLFIIILAIFNSVCIPLGLSFKPMSFDSNFYVGFNIFIDFCFWFDIILTFRTTFKHPRTGDEITNPKKLAINYIRSTFWIDFVSSINFEFIGQLFIDHEENTGLNLEEAFLAEYENVSSVKMDTYSLIACLKLIRVLRLGKLINYLNEAEDFKVQIRIY